MHPRLERIAVDVFNGNLARLAAFRLDGCRRGSGAGGIRGNKESSPLPRARRLVSGVAVVIGEFLSQAKSTGAVKSARQ